MKHSTASIFRVPGVCMLNTCSKFLHRNGTYLPNYKMSKTQKTTVVIFTATKTSNVTKCYYNMSCDFLCHSDQ